MTHTIGALYKLDGSKDRGNRAIRTRNNLSGVSVVDSYDNSRNMVTYVPFQFFQSRPHDNRYVPVISGPTSTPTLPVQRTAFLEMLKQNIHNLATAYNNDNAAQTAVTKQWWLSQGGNWTDFENAVAQGKDLTPTMLSTGGTVSGAGCGCGCNKMSGRRIGATNPFSLSGPDINGMYTVTTPWGSFTDTVTNVEYWLISPYYTGGGTDPNTGAAQPVFNNSQGSQFLTWVNGLEAKGISAGAIQTINNQYSVAVDGKVATLQNIIAQGNAIANIPPATNTSAAACGLLGSAAGLAANAAAPGTGSIAASGASAICTSLSATPANLPPNPGGSTNVIPTPPSSFPIVPVLIGAAVVGGLLFFAFSD